jgi:hypothetical protein
VFGRDRRNSCEFIEALTKWWPSAGRSRHQFALLLHIIYFTSESDDFLSHAGCCFKVRFIVNCVSKRVGLNLDTLLIKLLGLVNHELT